MMHNDTIHLIWRRTLHHLRISLLMKIARAAPVVLWKWNMKIAQIIIIATNIIIIYTSCNTQYLCFTTTTNTTKPDNLGVLGGERIRQHRVGHEVDAGIRKDNARAIVSDPWTDHAGPPPWAPRRSRSPSGTRPHSWRSPKGIAPSAPPRPLHFNYVTAKMRAGFHGIRQKHPALVVCGP